jgi:hypothetical protein
MGCAKDQQTAKVTKVMHVDYGILALQFSFREWRTRRSCRSRSLWMGGTVSLGSLGKWGLGRHEVGEGSQGQRPCPENILRKMDGAADAHPIEVRGGR